MSKAETVAAMIEKECCRNSLTELCEWWGITTDDFDRFIRAGKRNFQFAEVGTDKKEDEQ